jgi:ATP-dependent helicase IRC3
MQQSSLFENLADSWIPQRTRVPRVRPPLPLTLREYQAECKRITLQALSEGVHRQVAHLAVGLGKTIIFADLLDEVPEPFSGCNRTLVLAHREELIDQGAEKIRWLNPHLTVEIEMGSRHASPQADVVIASVATLGPRNKNHPDGFASRLLRLNPKEFKCIIIDECLTGDTKVVTDMGEIRLDRVLSSGARKVLTMSDGRAEYRPITNFFDQGVRDVWEVELTTGQKVRATANHPFHTTEGWIPVEKLIPGYHSVTTANVDVARSHLEVNTTATMHTSPVTETGNSKATRIGCAISRSIFRKLRYVRVAATSGSSQPSPPWKDSEQDRGGDITPGTCLGMINDQQTGTWYCQQKSDRQSWERSLEILPSVCQMHGAETPDSTLLIQPNRKIGQDTRETFCNDSTCDFWKPRTEGTVKGHSATVQAVSQLSVKSMIFSTMRRARSACRKIGSMASAKLGWRGGWAMTDQVVERRDFRSTRVDSRNQSTKSSHLGLKKSTALSMFVTTQKDTSSSMSPDPRWMPSCRKLQNTSPPVCDTNSVGISAIRYTGRERVYDISVEDTRCFFANGILVHNCHHSVANSYVRILKHFGADQPDTHLLLWGCSATPKRSDGVGLEKLFDQIIFSMGLVDGIEQGFLTTLRAVRVTTTTDLTGVDVRGGDWAEGQLGDRINNPERNDLIYNAWMDHIFLDDRKSTLAFCANVKHVYDLVEVFTRNNIDARGLDGTTDKEVRRKTVQAFRDQEFPVLVNCALMTEGTDIPNIDAIIMARPTQSSLLYQQCLGRGTRLFDGKIDCLVVDTVDASSGKNLMTVPSLFGLEPNFDAKGEDIMGVFRQMEQMVEENPLAVQATDIDHAKQIVSEIFDPLSSGTTDSIIHESSKLKWRKIGDHYWLEVPKQGSIEVSQDALGKYDVKHHAEGKAEMVRNRADAASALQAADAFIRETYPASMPLLERNASWRSEPMSDGQVGFFKKHKMPVPTDERGRILINKGEANERIDAKILQFRRNNRSKTKRKAKLNPRTEAVTVGAFK